jgi:hypothetical protein
LIRFSYNLIDIRLANFVKTWGLDIETKQHFPHAFNKEENLEEELDHLPDKEFYSPDSMMPADREEFLRWWEENKDQPFTLKESLAEYCYNGNLSCKSKFKFKFRRQNLNPWHAKDEGIVSGQNRH